MLSRLSNYFQRNYVEFHIENLQYAKNQRSQIVLNFILKIYNLLKIKSDRYFFHLKIAHNI